MTIGYNAASGIEVELIRTVSSKNNNKLIIDDKRLYLIKKDNIKESTVFLRQYLNFANPLSKRFNRSVSISNDACWYITISMSFQIIIEFITKVWNCICYLFNRHIRAYEPIKYTIEPVSPILWNRLIFLPKKILVLDLDETLVHSCHAAIARSTVKPGTPSDFKVNIIVDRQPVTFFVYKRPHVDYFLETVSLWYDVVLFTASLEIYGDAVANKLDHGRNILRRRYYRQHCTPDLGSYTKDLSVVCSDLNRICIVDNSPAAYRCFPNNAIPIKSYLSDPMDDSLLKILPFLDALRFTVDVRSVLSRNLHLHRTW